MGHMATTAGGMEVTCFKLKILCGTISENACLLVYSRISRSSGNSSNSKIKLVYDQNLDCIQENTKRK